MAIKTPIEIKYENLTIKKKLKILSDYMIAYIDALPYKISPYEIWVKKHLIFKERTAKKVYRQKVKQKCFYCRKDYEVETERTIDHVVAKSLGGLNRAENKVYACYDCNQWKYDKKLEKWLKEVKKELALCKEDKPIRTGYNYKRLASMIMSIQYKIRDVNENKKNVSIYKNY